MVDLQQEPQQRTVAPQSGHSVRAVALEPVGCLLSSESDAIVGVEQ